MSTKHVRTASDLVRFGCGLEVKCLSCGNSLIVGGFDVVRACGNVDVAELKRRLRCSVCNAKGAKVEVMQPMPKRD